MCVYSYTVLQILAPFFIFFSQDEDLKWVEDNIPSSLTDV